MRPATNFTIALIAVTAFSSLSAQESEKLVLSDAGVAPIVLTIDSSHADALYRRAKNWVQESYSSPKDVLKADIENEMIRIDGFARDAWHYKQLGRTQVMDMDYTLEVEFKEGRVRVTFTPGTFWAGGQRALYDYHTFFKSTGEVKPTYTEPKAMVEATMNDLVRSLRDYLLKGNAAADW